MSAQEFEQFYRSMSGKTTGPAVVALDAPIMVSESSVQQRKRHYHDREQAQQIAAQIREFRSFDFEKPGYHCDHG